MGRAWGGGRSLIWEGSRSYGVGITRGREGGGEGGKEEWGRGPNPNHFWGWDSLLPSTCPWKKRCWLRCWCFFEAIRESSSSHQIWAHQSSVTHHHLGPYQLPYNWMTGSTLEGNFWAAHRGLPHLYHQAPIVVQAQEQMLPLCWEG